MIDVKCKFATFEYITCGEHLFYRVQEESLYWSYIKEIITDTTIENPLHFLNATSHCIQIFR